MIPTLTHQIFLVPGNRRPNTILRLQQPLPTIEATQPGANLPVSSSNLSELTGLRETLRPATLDQHIQYFNNQKKEVLIGDQGFVQETHFTEGPITRMVSCLEKNKQLKDSFSSYMDEPSNPEKFLESIKSTELGIDLINSNKDIKPLLELNPVLGDGNPSSVFSVLSSTLNFINFQTDGWATYVSCLYDSLKGDSVLTEQCDAVLEGFYSELHCNLPFILYTMGVINDEFYSSLDAEGIRTLVAIVTSTNFYELADRCGSSIIKELFYSCNSIRDLIAKVELYGINTQPLMLINNSSEISEGEISEEQKSTLEQKQQEVDNQKNFKNDLRLVDFLISLLGIDLHTVWPGFILIIKFLTGAISFLTFIYAFLAIIVPLVSKTFLKIPAGGGSSPIPDNESVKDLIINIIKKFLKKL